MRIGIGLRRPPLATVVAPKRTKPAHDSDRLRHQSAAPCAAMRSRSSCAATRCLDSAARLASRSALARFNPARYSISGGAHVGHMSGRLLHLMQGRTSVVPSDSLTTFDPATRPPPKPAGRFRRCAVVLHDGVGRLKLRIAVVSVAANDDAELALEDGGAHSPVLVGMSTTRIGPARNNIGEHLSPQASTMTPL